MGSILLRTLTREPRWVICAVVLARWEMSRDWATQKIFLIFGSLSKHLNAETNHFRLSGVKQIFRLLNNKYILMVTPLQIHQFEKQRNSTISKFHSVLPGNWPDVDIWLDFRFSRGCSTVKSYLET